MYMGPHSDAHVCVPLCKEVGADVGSQLEMLTCNNTCIHSNQGI